MSVIRKKPEIESIIEALNDTEKGKLSTEINNSAPLVQKSLINVDYYFEPLSEGEYEIIGVLLQVAPTVTLPGIAIRTAAGEYFLEFADNQQLVEYHLDIANRKIEKIEEELDINELRRVLGMDVIGGEIEANDVSANPTLAGTEAELTGIEIDGTKYKVFNSGGVTDPSVKPIYCHPITIDDDVSDNKVHIAMLIFDNSNEEYNTLEKLTNKLNAIFAISANAAFPITGGLYYNAGSAVHIAQKIVKPFTVIQIKTVRPNGTQGSFDFDNTYLGSATFYDGVNKIN